MIFRPIVKPENSPYLQLLMLAAYALAGLIVCSILGVLIIIAGYGLDGLSNNALSGQDLKYLNGLKIFQILSSIGLFLLPPIALAWEQSGALKSFYGFGKPKIGFLFLVFLIMVCAMPFMEWTALTNQKMAFPGFLKSIEEWMRAKEDQAMKMTILLLKVNSVWSFLLNLLMIALLPAVSEELMFRGGVQRSFSRMFNNHHIAIWATAFIFSAIHMQFFGFVPRLLLGAVFGYLYHWSGSLWYAMLGHFLNNAYAVCAAWYLQSKNIPLTDADDTFHFAWYGYALSFIVAIFLLRYFKTKTSNEQQLD
eukprot:gene11462-14044_t